MSEGYINPALLPIYDPAFVPDYEMSAVFDPELGIHEVNGTRSESYGTSEFTAHAEFYCPWKSRVEAQYHIMQKIYNAPPYYFAYYLPAEVQSVQIGVLGAEGINRYLEDDTYQPQTLAKLTVEYKGLSRNGNLSLNEQLQPSLKMRQLPAWGYYWRSDGSPVLDNESPAIQEVQAKITRSIDGLRRIPAWFYELAGCVNNAPWIDALTGTTYLPGTLLFIPTNCDRTLTLARGDDDSIWKIGFELNWNPIGWNNYMRPNGVDTMMKNNALVCFYPYKLFPTLGADLGNLEEENWYNYSYIAHMVDDTNGRRFDVLVDRYGNVGWVYKDEMNSFPASMRYMIQVD